MENSIISDKVYDSILNKKLVDIRDRVYPLDYWLCILAFVFDMSYPVTFKMMQENNYINIVIDRFNYKNEEIKSKMENIRCLVNNFIEEKANG